MFEIGSHFSRGFQTGSIAFYSIEKHWQFDSFIGVLNNLIGKRFSIFLLNKIVSSALNNSIKWCKMTKIHKKMSQLLANRVPRNKIDFLLK